MLDLLEMPAESRSVQRALMPERCPNLAGWDVWLYTRPANGEGGTGSAYNDAIIASNGANIVANDANIVANGANVVANDAVIAVRLPTAFHPASTGRNRSTGYPARRWNSAAMTSFQGVNPSSSMLSNSSVLKLVPTNVGRPSSLRIVLRM